MSRVLVVGSSRVLDRAYLHMDPTLRATREEMARAEGILLAELGTLQTGDSVITGDAPFGFDRWVIEYVGDMRHHGHAIEVCIYALDGSRRFLSGRPSEWWANEPQKALARDEFMAGRAKAARAAGFTVNGLFAAASWSPTGGAAFTARAMERLDLAVRLETITRGA